MDFQLKTFAGKINFSNVNLFKYARNFFAIQNQREGLDDNHLKLNWAFDKISKGKLQLNKLAKISGE